MGVTSADATGSAVELEFELRDRDCFFVDASATADCRVELEHVVNRSDDWLLEYFTVEGTAPNRVLSMVEETPVIETGRLISRGVDGGLFEFVVSGPCVTTTLADTGAIASSVLAEHGVGTIIADVPAHVDTRSVVEEFRDHYQASRLIACHSSDGPVPVRTERGVHAKMAERLTEKQQKALRTAYMSGYFSWPRRATAEECADALGISQPTFSQHIRIAEKKLIGRLFEDDVHSRGR